MRILFLSHYFPPEVNAPASRTFEHCREWVRAGHHVTVITCAPNHPRGEVYPGYRNRFVQRENVEGIDVVRVWSYMAANEGFAKRTANYVSYMIMAILVAPWLARTDVVISTSPQFFNGLAGYAVSRLKRTPWVLEIRDLWPESILAVGAIKNPRVIRFLEWLEMFAYRKADRIVPVTDAFKNYMVDKGVDAAKIEVIKNGVDLQRYQPAQKDPELVKEQGLDGRFVASYFGTHGMAHHLETILDAAELLSDRNDIVFLLVGDGAERERLLAEKERRKLNNVIMLPQQPKDRMPALWASSDASLVLLKKFDLFKTVIPSKIFESMAMQCPILLGVDGEARQIVEQAGAGLYCEPENAVSLVENLERLVQDRALGERMGEAGRECVSRLFDRRVLATRYLKLLENALWVSPANL